MRTKLVIGITMLLLVFLAGCGSGTDADAEKTDSKAKDVYAEDYNIYNLPKLPIKEEFLETILENDTVRVERIISTGQVSDEWYDQDEDEYVVLVEGRATLEYENGDILKMKRGDTVLIPKHQKHKVTYTSKDPACIWLCVFWGKES